MELSFTFGEVLWSFATSFLSIWTLYISVLFLYRITFHPLAKFPGPKLAAMSFAYEFWFDVVRGGRYTKQILRMHEKYVRINPEELHCNDPNFVDTVYASGNHRRNKSPQYVFAYPALFKSTEGSLDHDHHRMRNAAMSRCFSRSRICQIENLVHEKTHRLCDKILALRGCEPFRIVDAYSCFTADMISEYLFGESDGYLDLPGWEPNYRSLVDAFERNIHIFRHVHGLASLAEKLPLFLTNWLSKELKTIAIDVKVTLPKKIQKAMKLSDAVVYSTPSIMSTMLASSLPSSEKTLGRLTGEAMSLMAGGTESTSVTLTLFTFHILSNPIYYHRLLEEISAITASPSEIPDWKSLEKLCFLNAVMLECLRLLPGVSGRSPRIATDEDLIYDGANSSRPTYVIPRGYPVSMSTYILHMDESIFPNAKDFVPDRWLDETGNVNRILERRLLSFSRGNRQCIGRQLALCELHVCAAAMILRVFPYMELFETSRVDVDYDHDELIGKPSPQSKGVRVRVRDSGPGIQQ
ncbi:unnamed protein product [Clonostachys rosea]|uniref:Cytochrome P450 n=1 Tax=Bionectria ochroleuca TaxID=29856 RepID=A0ABY6U3Y4_BIOOC|nr:unnamed protein product [Clonostachys rosea]